MPIWPKCVCAVCEKWTTQTKTKTKTTTHHIICGDDFLEDLRQHALGLQVGVLVSEVKHQQGTVVGSSQSRRKGQDALL